jgi:hypothetical protein
MFKFLEIIPPVNSEVLLHLKNIENPTGYWSTSEIL